MVLAVQNDQRVLGFLFFDHDFPQVATVLLSEDLFLVDIIVEVLVLNNSDSFSVQNVDQFLDAVEPVLEAEDAEVWIKVDLRIALN